ncbi:MAG: hypothetical protein QM770_16715 [Tepidisphaeraceae bacterium]
MLDHLKRIAFGGSLKEMLNHLLGDESNAQTRRARKLVDEMKNEQSEK